MVNDGEYVKCRIIGNF